MARVAKRRDRYVLDYYDNQGERHRDTLQKGTTQARAKELLRDIEDQLAKGTYLPAKKIPAFKEVAADWIEHKKVNLRASTWSVYKTHTAIHFTDLDPLKINQVTVAGVEKFMTDRLNGGMNILTLRKIMVSLGQIMAYAVRHKYIDHNPVRDAERPRGQGKGKKKQIEILSPEEIQAFLGAVEDPKYLTLFKLAIFSGARQGELLGLKWSDIDWKQNQIHIQRTFNMQEWYDPKTETSDRRIDIGPSMMADLKKWKVACPPNKLHLVFPNEAGEPLNHSNLRSRHFYPAIKKAGIPKKIRFHDLRHTFASLMIEQGENIKYIQTQLGHSSPTVTLNVYAHLMKKVNPEAAQRLENTVLEANRSQSGHSEMKKAN